MSNSKLQQKIGFWSASSIIIGSIIGAGVFMKPSSMAMQLGSPIWLFIIWIIAGLFSLLGAFIYAELGAQQPITGGVYAYFREMFGDFFAFLYGWAAFSVINTAAVAAISFVCAQYADYFLHLPRFSESTEQSWIIHLPFIGDLFPLENAGVKLLAIFLVMLLTWINAISLKASARTQVVSTAVKVLVIAILIAGIFSSCNGSFSNFFDAPHPKEGMTLFGGIIASLTGAFYAYDGWINITFIAGEVKMPQKNIPASLIIGVLACIAIYVLVNQAYLFVLDIDSIANSKLVAADAIKAAIGNTGGAIVAALIVLCTFGAINGNIMATSRVTYAMGRDKLFFPAMGKVHPRHDTPANALYLHGIWTSLFIITGSFDMLADMFVFITWIAYLFGALGIFILRKKFPNRERPYKVWGYPWVPLIFIIFSAFYLVTTVWNDVTNYINHRQPIINSLLGLIITFLGLPVYFYCKRLAAKAAKV